MANNFLQFSLLVPLRSPAEASWVTSTLTSLVKLLDGTEGARAGRGLSALGRRYSSEGWDCLDFEWSIKSNELWLYAEESGSPEQVAAVLEAYLAKFNPTGVITFSWAFTCSKLRPNEFGGGAAVITAGGTTFLDAQTWAKELAEKHAGA